MTITINFVLLREGSSDEGLIPHLRELIVRAGAVEATGTPRRHRGTVESKLLALAGEHGSIDMVFVHRDADSTDVEPRYVEILRAGKAASLNIPVVAVVPVQELEAWLLLDELAIRTVVGRPRGKEPLGLPALNSVESRPRPKEILEQACLAASESTGRRRERERRMLAERRRVLLERLDIDGPIRELVAWQRLEQEIHECVATLIQGQS